MKNQSETHRFDEKQALNYDDRIRRLIPAYAALHQMVNALLQSLLPADAQILVVGAGTGMDVITCGLANPNWSFTAIEPSEEMFELCRRNISQAGLSERVRLHCGYVENLPSGQNFHAATSILVSHFIQTEEDKVKYFSNISSLLKTDAPLVLADLYGERESEAFAVLFNGWKQFFSNSVSGVSEVDKASAYIQQDISFISEGRLQEILQKSGFGDIRVFFKTFLVGGWICRKQV